MSEPVALVSNMCNDSIDWKVDPLKLDEGTPLYTHPVKELTDEEIDNISDEIPHYIDTYAGRRMFARAILIKAQEK